MKEQPIVCTLSPAALQARRTGLLSQLIARTRDHRELPDGYRFVFDATEDILVGAGITVIGALVILGFAPKGS